jgi:predicted pyridoxine 5'-phosphate oxidase superfamily flavin-nucleotide-binding protein
MIKIPEEVKKAWDSKQDPIVLTTVSKQGVPNSIYATCVALFEDSYVLVANNKFKKTYQNIMENDKATLLFITKEKKAYQIKGKIKYETEGKAFDDMKKWNRPDLAGYGVAKLEVEEIYSGANKIS